MRTWKLTDQKEHQLWEVAFLCVYGVVLSRYFLDTTLLAYRLVEWLPNIVSYRLWIRLMAGTIVMAKAVRDPRYTWKELILAGILLASCWRCAQVTEYWEVVDLAILILGARGVSFRKILAVYVGVTAALMAVVLLCTWRGVIEDWIFYRWSGTASIEKHSFGFYYPNEFGAHVFFLCLGIAGLRRERISFVELGLMVAAAGLLQRYCYSRTNFLCILLLAFCLLMWKLVKMLQFSWNRSGFKLGIVCIALIPAFCCIFMIGLSAMYYAKSAFFQWLDYLLSGRLSLSKNGFVNYGIKMFGQYVEMIGVTLDIDVEHYNFLDCSYVNVLIRYGLAVFVSVGLLMAQINIRALRNRDAVLLLVVALCCIQSVMEHHLCDIAYHPLLLAAFAILPLEEPDSVREVTGKKLCTEEQMKAG